MRHLCIHTASIADAYDISEIFKHHSKVKEEPEIFFKNQAYNVPGRKRDIRRSYLTVIKLS